MRSERTRQSLIEAYLAVLRENPQIPTAAQIAARAGYSVRSIFERFEDLHALRVAATDCAFAQAAAQAAECIADGDRQTRLAAHVATRGSICEQWLPLWRALNANVGESMELRSRMLMMRQAIQTRIEIMYRPELEVLDDRARQQTVIAIESLIDFESWARMREINGLTVEEAHDLWRGAIDRLLPPTPLS